MLCFNQRLVVLGVIVICAHYLTQSSSQTQLRVGFYSRTCPQAESIVRSVVQAAVASDPTMAAVLLRLHFHDCFVEGCDGSILIDNGANAEKNAFGHQGVRGFDVIEAAKSRLESVCRGVVSCADIVALAARDAISLSRGPSYAVPTGRRDGRVSDLSLAANMPDVRDSIQLLRSKFRRMGLSDRDLVLLSAAHSIGTTACFFMTHRLYNFTGRGDADPAISRNFLPKLKATCPNGGDVNVRLPLDPMTGQVLDDQILRNIRAGFAVIESDARLYDDRSTRQLVDFYSGFRNSQFGSPFGSDFARSMVKMGQIGVKTGFKGEIRQVCRSFN
ncbi:peroxidase 43 [Malania oleifera]|uniref:peroxidase 43 n=1 Tax=Malania oleifera TaxID=397392 RepID=UPI0025AE3644|nr:peroxidase 43 [Malania oleifera]